MEAVVEEVLPTSSQPEVVLNSDEEDQEQDVPISYAQIGEATQVCFYFRLLFGTDKALHTGSRP